MQRSMTRIRTSHVGRLPPPKGCEDMPGRLASAEITDPAVIAAQVIRPFVVSRQSVTEEEAVEWFDELAKLEESGAYFFCITPVLTEAVRVV